MTDQQILEAIKCNDLNRALDALYTHYDTIKSYVLSNSGAEEDARDVFQDALIILCERVSKRDFQLEGSLKNYLFGVCRYRWFAVLRDRKKSATLHEPVLASSEMAAVDEHLEREARFTALEQAMKGLGNECKKLLQWFYFKKTSLKEIGKRLGLSSENAAKTRKFRCLEQARKLAMEAFVESEKSML